MFKYSLKLTGKEEIRERFAEELNKLGYKKEGHQSFALRCTLVNPSPLGRMTFMENGDYANQSSGLQRHFEFNIDNEWEFNAALGIAAIRDEEWNVGEYFYHSAFDTFCLIDKVDVFYYYSHVGEKETSGYFKKGSQSFRNSRKATPEEIIEHFKPRTTPEDLLKQFGGIVANAVYNIPQTKTEKMKEIIGYKAPQDLFDGSVKKDKVFVKYRTSTSAFYHPKDSGDLYTIPKEWVETWEPVYKEEEYKVGDYLIAEGEESMYSRIDLNKGEIIRIVYDDGEDWRYDIIDNPNSHTAKFFSKKDKGEGFTHSFRKATPEEIEKHLIEVAKKKGFVENVWFTGVRDSVGDDWEIGSGRYGYNKETGQVGNGFKYHADRDLLITHGNGLHILYEKGVWATIPPREKEIVVGSNNLVIVIQKGNIFTQKGAYSFTIGELIQMHKIYSEAAKWKFGGFEVNHNRDVRFIRVGCKTDNNLFSLEDLKLVIDTYNEVNK